MARRQRSIIGLCAGRGVACGNVYSGSLLETDEALADAQGLLLAILLTGGEVHDCPVAERLIRRVKPSKRLLGDKGYDSGEFRDELHERGTKPVIPNRCNRKQPFGFSKRLYKLRWRIENAFNRLKDFRRIATRYDRLARNYLASVCLAAALVWWI